MIQHSICGRAELMYVFFFSDGSTGDSLSVSLYLSLVVSLTALVALVVLLVNCVTCCKEREINFKVSPGRQVVSRQVSTCSHAGST